MKVDRKDGKRVVTLDAKNQTALANARDVCDELADLVDDATAEATAESLAVLISKYSPKKTEPASSAATATGKGATEKSTSAE